MKISFNFIGIYKERIVLDKRNVDDDSKKMSTVDVSAMMMNAVQKPVESQKTEELEEMKLSVDACVNFQAMNNLKTTFDRDFYENIPIRFGDSITAVEQNIKVWNTSENKEEELRLFIPKKTKEALDEFVKSKTAADRKKNLTDIIKGFDDFSLIFKSQSGTRDFYDQVKLL